MKILIVSGAGILAGTNFYNKLIRGIIELDKFKKDSDFPEVVLYNYPFKSIQENGQLDEVSAKTELEEILGKFSDFDHIIIACNTFHVLDLGVKNLLSLPVYALKGFNDNQLFKKGLVLCSAYSREKKLFNNENLLYPNIELNKFIDKVIHENIYSYNQYKKEQFKELNEFIEKEKVTHLIIGCTELSIIDWKALVDIPVIDGGESIINNLLKKLEGK
jgi:aspartate/glutamate racemase